MALLGDRMGDSIHTNGGKRNTRIPFVRYLLNARENGIILKQTQIIHNSPLLDPLMMVSVHRDSSAKGLLPPGPHRLTDAPQGPKGLGDPIVTLPSGKM